MSQDKAAQRKELKDHGILYVSGAIDAGASEEVCRQIIEINVAGEADSIQMIINSPGGSCYAGFAVIDIMEWSRVPIYTTGIGLVGSMALLLFMTGQKGRRVVTPRTSLLSHRYAALSAGNHSQLIAGRKEEDLLHRRIAEHYLQYCAVESQEELERSLLRDVDTWLSAEEAVRYGIADVIEPLARGRIEAR